jgi:hypothetical protein
LTVLLAILTFLSEFPGDVCAVGFDLVLRGGNVFAEFVGLDVAGDFVSAGDDGFEDVLG